MLRVRRWSRRTKLIVSTTLISTLILLSPTNNFAIANLPWKAPDKCTPQKYASGSWKYRPRTNATVMTRPEDALTFSGFEKCAGVREYELNLAADKKSQWDRFPRAQSYEWVSECDNLRPLNSEEFVRDLVQSGGWYLVGDSITENHFFSLSCILYPHVIANFTPNVGWDRDWPQHFYLNPDSPLIATLSLPPGFNITSTPLATFRRIDILLSKDELRQIHRSIQPANSTLENDALFSQELVWTRPVQEYLDEFLSPESDYGTMVVSTAGHWTVGLFNATQPKGIEGVLNLFEAAMTDWANKVQNALKTHTGCASWFCRRRRKNAVIRAYLPGHERCHDHREPWTEVQPFLYPNYNWGEIWRYNSIFAKILSSDKYPNIHYLGIDRPARLRPDAHTTHDCLHIMTGAGVLEGWSHYIWHYTTRVMSK